MTTTSATAASLSVDIDAVVAEAKPLSEAVDMQGSLKA